MARINKAVPKWNEEKQIWELQKQINGKRKYFSSSNKKGGYQECIRLFNSWLGQGARTKDPRIKDVAEDYLQSVIDEFGENSYSYKDAENAIRLRILPAIKSKKLSDLNEQDFQKILNTSKNLNTGKNLSKKTVQNIRSEINLFCKYLYKANLIDWTPQFLEVPKKLEYKGKKYWQTDEALHFLKDDDIEDIHLLACKLILVYGFRPSEVYGLQENDISKNVISIKRALNEDYILTKGKNKNARRKELLTDIAKRIILEALEFKQNNNLNSKFIFVDLKCRPLIGENVRKALKRYCLKNNLTVITPYSLRHTLATLSKHNLTERQLKRIYGHSDKMNTDIYVHELDDEHLEAGNALNNYWNTLLNLDS